MTTNQEPGVNTDQGQARDGSYRDVRKPPTQKPLCNSLTGALELPCSIPRAGRPVNNSSGANEEASHRNVFKAFSEFGSQIVDRVERLHQRNLRRPVSQITFFTVAYQ